MGTAPNLTDVEDGLDQVGNLESAVEPMPTFTSVNPAPCRVGPPHLGFYRSSSSQSNQKVAPQRACCSLHAGIRCQRRIIALISHRTIEPKPLARARTVQEPCCCI